MQTIVSIRYIIVVLVLIQTLASNTVWAQDDDVKLDQLKELIVQEVNKAAQTSYYDYELMRIEALALEFDLNSSQLKKPKVFARKEAANQRKGREPAIKKFLYARLDFRRNKAALLDAKIVVNGKAIANEDSTDVIEIDVDTRKRWIKFVRTVSSGGISSYGVTLQIGQVVDFGRVGWQGAFKGVLSPKQLRKYQREFKERESQALARGCIRLQTQYCFTPEQEKQIQRKISENIRPKNGSTIEDFESQFRGKAPGLSGEDFLNDSQKLLLNYADGTWMSRQVRRANRQAVNRGKGPPRGLHHHLG